eukprot:1160336-Pelagomonas_calceolata.AAC.13
MSGKTSMRTQWCPEGRRAGCDVSWVVDKELVPRLLSLVDQVWAGRREQNWLGTLCMLCTSERYHEQKLPAKSHSPGSRCLTDLKRSTILWRGIEHFLAKPQSWGVSPKICLFRVKFTPGCPGPSSAPPALKPGMQAKQTSSGSPVMSRGQMRPWAKPSNFVKTYEVVWPGGAAGGAIGTGVAAGGSWTQLLLLSFDAQIQVASKCERLMPPTEHSLSAVYAGAGFGAGFSGDEECARFAVGAMRSRTPYSWALE